MNLQKRIVAIDRVRGFVMILMALDHVRDLLHETSLTQNPLDLDSTTPQLFFTRWITHLCAPSFVFLSGVSAWLSLKKNPGAGSNRKFLWKRGLWLLLLEFTLINFVLWFDFQFRILIMQVIAAIGVGLILLSFLAKCRPAIVGIISLVIIFSHNLLQYVPVPENPVLAVLTNLFFRPGIQQVNTDMIFFVAYPLVPWVAIMLLGFSFGRLFEMPEQKQKKFLWITGIVSLSLFIVIRFINVYGDPSPWVSGKNAIYTFLSFINVTKYPPSLLFTLLFLGIMFLLLRLAMKLPGKIPDIISLYGKVPLFYYVLHLLLIRLAVFIMVYLQGFRWKDLLFGPFQFGRPATGSGISLGSTYLAWIVLVIVLYPVCKWYGRYKAVHYKKWWPKYL